MKYSVHLLSIHKPQETETADEETGDDTLSTTALPESASLGCGEGEGEGEKEREREREREGRKISTHLCLVQQ